MQAVIKLESWKLQQRLTIYRTILDDSFVQIPLLNKWPETFSSVRQTDIWHDDQLHGHHRDRIVSYPLAALLSRRKKKSPNLTSVHANSPSLPIGARQLIKPPNRHAPTPINYPLVRAHTNQSSNMPSHHQSWAKLLRSLTVNSLSYFVKTNY